MGGKVGSGYKIICTYIFYVDLLELSLIIMPFSDLFIDMVGLWSSGQDTGNKRWPRGLGGL